MQSWFKPECCKNIFLKPMGITVTKVRYEDAIAQHKLMVAGHFIQNGNVPFDEIVGFLDDWQFFHRVLLTQLHKITSNSKKSSATRNKREKRKKGKEQKGKRV
jgi:hypothetical protein